MGRLIALVLVVAACGPKQKAPERIVTVSVVEGEATQLGVQITAGSQIAMDEFLFVGEGRVELAMSWAGTLRIFPHSTVLLATALADQRGPDVQLAIGKLWAKIQGLNGNTFEVSTANAVAGVRGTEFVVQADEKESEVYVVEGEVQVQSLAEPKTKRSVKAQQRTRVVATLPAPPAEAHESVVHQTQWIAPRPAPAPSPAPVPVTPTIAPQPVLPPTEPEPAKPTKHPKKALKPEAPKEPDPPPPPPPAAEASDQQGPKRPAFEIGAPTKGKRKKPLPPAQPATNWPPKP